MGEAASDFVLTGDEIARLELGREVELRAAVGAEARGASGLAVASPTARAASISATGGTDVTPAPIRAVRMRLDSPETRRVETVPPRARAEPRAVASKRLDTRETAEPAGATGLSAPASGVPQTSQ